MIVGDLCFGCVFLDLLSMFLIAWVVCLGSDDLLLLQKCKNFGKNGLFEGVDLVAGEIAQNVFGDDFWVIRSWAVDAEVESFEVVGSESCDYGLDTIVASEVRLKFTKRCLFA